MITVIAALRFEVVLNCSVEHIVPAKFRELSQMKLADWAVHGWSSFLAALGAGIFKHAARDNFTHLCIPPLHFKEVALSWSPPKPSCWPRCFGSPNSRRGSGEEEQLLPQLIRIRE